MVDLDELLYGVPTWEQVVEFFRDGEFHSEEYEVEAIEKHLMTEDQRKWMFDNHLSIEKCLNGRYTGDIPVHEMLYKPWNDKLGFTMFGG